MLQPLECTSIADFEVGKTLGTGKLTCSILLYLGAHLVLIYQSLYSHPFITMAQAHSEELNSPPTLKARNTMHSRCYERLTSFTLSSVIALSCAASEATSVLYLT